MNTILYNPLGYQFGIIDFRFGVFTFFEKRFYVLYTNISQALILIHQFLRIIDNALLIFQVALFHIFQILVENINFLLDVILKLDSIVRAILLD